MSASVFWWDLGAISSTRGAGVPVSSCAPQSSRVTHEFVQHVKNLAEGGPLCSFPLPAVQHQLVQHQRAVHGSGQAVTLFDGFDHLDGKAVMT